MIETLDAVEYYLSTPAHSKRAVSYLNNGKRKLMQCIAADQAYELIGAGVVASIQLLDKVESFMPDWMRAMVLIVQQSRR